MVSPQTVVYDATTKYSQINLKECFCLQGMITHAPQIKEFRASERKMDKHNILHHSSNEWRTIDNEFGVQNGLS